MAPTEVLARQHHATLARLLAPAGLTPALLTGRETRRRAARARSPVSRAARARSRSAPTRCSRTSVRFADLALAVIDEQHRFGVHQRLELAAKGGAADLLVMTATPIPRTLVLALYGDMAVSELREKPPGRRRFARARCRLPASTRSSRGAARARAAASSSTGCARRSPQPRTTIGPRPSSATPCCAAVSATPSAWSTAACRRPRRTARCAPLPAAALRLLVATTVIEVGVDVPEAGVIVIEHAERFGLAQLHQLRGRVGRGAPGVELPSALSGAAGRDRAGAPRGAARDRRRLSHRRGGSAPARAGRGARHAPERAAGVAPRRSRRPCRPAGAGARRRAAGPSA